MSNGDSSLRSRRGYTAESDRGYRDHALGLPFPAEYETWKERDQINYEFGRLRHANVCLAFPGSRGTKQQRALVEKAAGLVGDIFQGRPVVIDPAELGL